MKIAILDDDRTALQSVEQALVGGDDAWASTLNISFFTSGAALLAVLKARDVYFDALVLDRQVPDLGGDEVLAWVRAHLPPEVVVVMVTSLGGVSESVPMLNSGADDYVSKPFNGADLLVRLQRLLRRVENARATVDVHKSSAGRFGVFGFEFDRARLSVGWGDVVTLCSEREFELVVFLCRNAGRPLSREEIYESVYHRRSVNTSRALDTLVHRTRAKLQLDERRGLVVQPIYGFGYRLDVLEGESA